MLMGVGSQRNNLPHYLFSAHDAALTFLAYVFLAAFKAFLITPYKKTTVFKNTTLVSLLFLAHARSVIVTWMIYSRAIFLLLAGLSFDLLNSDSQFYLNHSS